MNTNVSTNKEMNVSDVRGVSGKEKEKEMVKEKERGKEKGDEVYEDNRSSGTFDGFEEVNEEDEIKSIPFLCPTPLRVFVGHTQDVIDISWSKSHFILSASADHNVRLWHVTRGDCLQVFRHPDIATSIDFHPLHDRFFVSGCFDRRLRIWDIISNARTKEWVSLSETVSHSSHVPYTIFSLFPAWPLHLSCHVVKCTPLSGSIFIFKFSTGPIYTVAINLNLLNMNIKLQC